MREHVVSTLQTIAKGGKPISDEDMISWANKTASRSNVGASANFTISRFGDQQLKTGVFFLRIIDSLSKGAVDNALVTEGQNGTIFWSSTPAASKAPFQLECDAKMNAKYAISIARKLGATIFLLPEDIVEVKPKMVSSI
jgi:plastin-1